MNNDQKIRCGDCVDLLPDYEWLDIDCRKQVDVHIAGCDVCCAKKEMIFGNFTITGEKGGAQSIIDKIDFSDVIMQKIKVNEKTSFNPFLLQMLGALVVLEMIVIFFSGFVGVIEGIGWIGDFYQYVNSMIFPVFDESVGLFEEVGYYSFSAEYLPDGFNAFLLFAGLLIAAALIVLSFFSTRSHSNKRIRINT
jgi:hypothetical protein